MAISYFLFIGLDLSQEYIYSLAAYHKFTQLVSVPGKEGHICVTVFIRINTPGGFEFSKGEGGGGGVTLTDKKDQLSSPVAMGDNENLQP